MTALIDVFPTPAELLAVPAEDLAGIILEMVPGVMQNGMFNVAALMATLYRINGPTYPNTSRRPVMLAMGEALSWLIGQGLVMIDPEQPAVWYVLTRRAAEVQTRANLDAYRRGRILPNDLMPPIFVAKVAPLFRRGDVEIAVFQASKELEVSVRCAANARGANYPDDMVGTKLMRAAFHPDTGPLTDQTLVAAERQAETDLFAGAIGHAKNPTSHRDVAIPPVSAARLILFISHLMDIVVTRR